MLVVTVALAFAACSAGAPSDADLAASKPVEEIAQEVLAAVTEAMTMRDENLESIKEYYGYELDKYASYVMYNPMIVNADTVHIVEVTDIADIEAAKAELEANRARVENNFSQYLPGPYEMAKQGEIVSKGRYAMLIISPNNAAGIEIFNNSIS